MFSPTSALLSMSMDIYKQFDEQDVNTGALKKNWHYYKTVKCHVKGVISNSATTRTSDKQTFDNRYFNDQILQIRTSERLTLREKITNICDSNGYCIWTEIDFPSNTPTVFEVVGSTPITDPFGMVLGYNTSVRRSENQQIGI
jgi:hypothetical protein